MSIHRFALVLSLLLPGVAFSQQATTIDVYKSPLCGCCGAWVDHLRENGFQVRTHDVQDVGAARKKLGMPEHLGSCHTAKVGAYSVEGHVPAADIKRLLKEKPAAVGIAVPGMPAGSPGMESPRPVPYQTLLVRADGATSVFARH